MEIFASFCWVIHLGVLKFHDDALCWEFFSLHCAGCILIWTPGHFLKLSWILEIVLNTLCLLSLILEHLSFFYCMTCSSSLIILSFPVFYKLITHLPHFYSIFQNTCSHIFSFQEQCFALWMFLLIASCSCFKHALFYLPNEINNFTLSQSQSCFLFFVLLCLSC